MILRVRELKDWERWKEMVWKETELWQEAVGKEVYTLCDRLRASVILWSLTGVGLRLYARIVLMSNIHQYGIIKIDIFLNKFFNTNLSANFAL